MPKDKRLFWAFVIAGILFAAVVGIFGTRKEHPVYIKVEPYAVADYLALWEEGNMAGDDQAEDPENKGKDPEEDTSEYIIWDSAERNLTDEDLASLTLREINYAKNEIYARHGRKFDSQELRNYFESKSWYEGKISPEDFDEGILNDCERANAAKLREKEYSINSKGYPLDEE